MYFIRLSLSLLSLAIILIPADAAPRKCRSKAPSLVKTMAYSVTDESSLSSLSETASATSTLPGGVGIFSYVKKDQFPLLPVTVLVSNSIADKQTILENVKSSYPHGQILFSGLSRAIRSILYPASNPGNQKSINIYIKPDNHIYFADADLGGENMRVKRTVFASQPNPTAKDEALSWLHLFAHEFTHFYQNPYGVAESMADVISWIVRQNFEPVTCQNNKIQHASKQWDQVFYCDGAVFLAWVSEAKSMPNFLVDLNQRVADPDWKSKSDGFYAWMQGNWREYQMDGSSSEKITRYFDRATNDFWTTFAGDLGYTFNPETKEVTLIENIPSEINVRFE